MKDPSKTEKPTAKKVADARKKGSVAKSQDATMAVILLAAFLLLRNQWPDLAEGLMSLMREYLGNFPTSDLSVMDFSTLLLRLIVKLVSMLAPIMLTLLLVGILINFVQIGRLWSWEGLKPDLNKLNPITGFKRFFSLRQTVETFKGILKISVIILVTFQVISDRFPLFATAIGADQAKLGFMFAETAWTIAWRSAWVLMLIGAFDYFYQRYEYFENLKMTKHEVEDEAKQQELPSEVKGKMREAQAMLARRRMMQEIPKASVVITNPTHLAIALRYDKKDEEVPIVLAKGADRLAERIKEIAREAKVPLVENKPVAQALFKQVEIGEEIPKDLYTAVAEILVLVTRLNKRHA
ncbi:MAG TPA: flagellar biosynthesis protein FlhB [Cyanobacteria bacterium UBA8530]|nr:flagellar biosynthesis protein FlhB [Cyanobacteria bacterium UBA8530]